MKLRTKSKGFSVVELTVVIAVVMGIIAFIFSQVADVNDDNDISQFRGLYTQLVTKISTFYQPDYDYSSITSQVVVEGDLGPSVMLRGTGSSAQVVTSFGNSCDVAVDGARTDLFTITCSNTPITGCASLIRMLDDLSLRIEMGASAGSLTPVKDRIAATPMALDRSLVTTTCSSLAASSAFTFRTTHR